MICLPTLSQNHKWSIGLEGSPTFNNILYSTGKENVDNSLKMIFHPNFGYTFGLDLNYRLINKISLSTGICVTKRGHVREEYFEQYPTDWSDNPNYVNATVKIAVNQPFLEIPLGLKIDILELNKGYLSCAMGGTFNFPLHERTKVYTYYPEYTQIYVFDVKPHEKNFRTVYLGLYTSVIYNYNFNSRIGLKIEPMFNYMFGGPELFSDVNWLHSYYLACKIGITYKI
jgi:hypothetical protein